MKEWADTTFFLSLFSLFSFLSPFLSSPSVHSSLCFLSSYSLTFHLSTSLILFPYVHSFHPLLYSPFPLCLSSSLPLKLLFSSLPTPLSPFSLHTFLHSFLSVTCSLYFHCTPFPCLTTSTTTLTKLVSLLSPSLSLPLLHLHTIALLEAGVR